MSITLRAPRIALFSGSARKGSFNTKLVDATHTHLQALGAEARILDLSSYELPLYHQDLEASSGLPEAALSLKGTLQEADAWVVASPEYNGFPSPLLINAYTWMSRGDKPEDGMYATFRNKLALVMGASPGAMGGLRAIQPHHQLLSNLGVTVLPQTVAIGGAMKAFQDDHSLVDPKQDTILQSAVQNLFESARDVANRDSMCELVKQHGHTESAGDYGAVSMPSST